MESLLSFVISGFPSRADESPPNLQDFIRFRSHLKAHDGVVLYKDRIVIPKSLQIPSNLYLLKKILIYDLKFHKSRSLQSSGKIKN